MPTFRAGLTGVPWVNFDHLNSACFSFIAQEAVELGKRPGVQTALTLTFFVSNTFPNIGQVLKNNRAARSGVLNNSFTEDVVMVSSLAKQFPTQLFEMSLSRSGAFCLKLATETENAAFLLFPSAFSQEMAIAGDGWVIEPKVNTNHRLCGINNRSRDIHFVNRHRTPVPKPTDQEGLFPPQS
jgi:hypothetical protein